MSEFTNSKERRILKLKEVSELLLSTGNAREFIIDNEEFIQTVLPSDFIYLFDQLFRDGYPMEKLKVLSNKVLNIFRIPIENFESIVPEPDSFLGVLEQNNAIMNQVLDGIRPIYKTFAKDPGSESVRAELLQHFNKLEVFVKHYTIKENILFPVIEKMWDDYRCLKIMWSFHDDIRRDIKSVINQLSSGEIEIKRFNRCVGDIFFHTLSIRFREERILFPYILTTFNEEQLTNMNREGFEMGYPYIQAPKPDPGMSDIELQNGKPNLGTGVLTVEQIKLIFNHLPVDITYVDEQNKVRYFSTPKKRIFPRSNAVIGREVKNCHPAESVHVVERIVDSFKSGEKSHADFWIKVKGEFVLIQYFAVRDDHGSYKGVIEVSQEISDIRALEGEKRLLDW